MMFRKNRQKKDATNQHPESKQLDYIDEDRILESITAFCKYLVTMKRQIEQQDRQMSQVLELRGKDLAMLEKCFDAAADCQMQMAKIANSQIERHALHPAIITVDLLDDLISQIAIQADSVTDIQPDSQVRKLIDSIGESRRIAASKKEHLDIVDICPSELESLDSNQHEIVSAVNTSERSNHKKIKETLRSGLIYRSNVLRRAKVSVYRFKENNNTQQSERKSDEKERK